MCGIVGAISRRNVADILLEGLKRLEYRGYDSAGVALIDEAEPGIATVKTVGKVAKLIAAAKESRAAGNLGIAHTRWATHGGITAANAHPHGSGGRIALVHNGIIENHGKLRGELRGTGYRFATETDTEVIAHLIHQALERGRGGLFEATTAAVGRLRGAYGLCVIDRVQPDRIVVARSDMSLVIGVGIGENFVASDATALGQVTDRFIYLEQGDLAQLTRDGIEIHNRGKPVKREVAMLGGNTMPVDKGRHRHFMRKEIFEQPKPSATRSPAASAETACSKRLSASLPAKSSARSARCKSSPAAPATTPGSLPSAGLSQSPGCPARSISPATTATATSSSSPARCLWRYRNPAKPPTPSPPCATPPASATWRRWRSAMWR